MFLDFYEVGDPVPGRRGWRKFDQFDMRFDINRSINLLKEFQIITFWSKISNFIQKSNVWTTI